MSTSTLAVASPKACSVSVNNINTRFLEYSREWLLQQHREQGGSKVLNPVISTNEANFIKSAKEIDMATATQENTVQQDIPARLLSVEDISRAKKISHSYVYTILKKLQPAVAHRNGNQNLYTPDVLEMFPERQRAKPRSRKQRRISAQQPPVVGQQQENVQQPVQAMPLLQRVERLENTINSLAQSNEALVQMNKTLLEQMEALHKSLGL